MSDRDDDHDKAQPARQSAVTRRGRLHTPSNGQPVIVVERKSRGMEAVVVEADATDAPLDGSLESLIERVIERRTRRGLRRLWAGIATALVAAAGALGGVAKGALDARESAGADKVRLHTLEIEVGRLRDVVFPPPPPYWRRDETPPAPSRPPDTTQRGPLP